MQLRNIFSNSKINPLVQKTMRVSLIGVKEKEDLLIFDTALKCIDSFPITINITLYTLTQFGFAMKLSTMHSKQELSSKIQSEWERIFDKRYRSLCRVRRNRIQKSDMDQHALDISDDDYEDNDFYMYYTSEVNLDEINNWDYCEVSCD